VKTIKSAASPLVFINLLLIVQPMEQVKHSRVRHRNNINQINPLGSGGVLNKGGQGFHPPPSPVTEASIQGSQAKPQTDQVNYRQEEKRILDRILAQEVYDTRMRPLGINSTDGPTIVRVNLYVRSFEKIDDVKMEYSVQITFRQQWNDNRLAFSDMDGRIKYLTMTDAKKVWMPDTFFRNEKHGKFHKIIQPNLYIRVYPNGDILYSIR